MVPGAEAFPAQRVEKAVWQLAFFAPLEETKGIKIFCDAVEQLPRTVLDRPGFEVSSSRGACGPDQGGSVGHEEKTSWQMPVAVSAIFCPESSCLRQTFTPRTRDPQPSSCSASNPIAWRQHAAQGHAQLPDAGSPLVDTWCGRTFAFPTAADSALMILQVHILGEEAKIDQKLSLPWIRARTAAWTWKTHVLPSPTK